jgi:hypothetical protein
MTRRSAALLLVCLGTAASAAWGSESIELRLLRSTQLGVLQGVTREELLHYTQDGTPSYLGFPLAVAALEAAGLAPLPDWDAQHMLDETLNGLHRDLSFDPPADMPADFGGEDLVFTLVYAMALGADAEQAVDTLQKHRGSRSEYKRAVLLQSLRNLGLPGANDLLQAAAEQDADRQLPENLLSDRYFPHLGDLHARLHLIPPEQRQRPELVGHAQEACGERQALAVYFLGFLAPAGNDAELALLRTLTAAHCYYTRYFAVRALALRSPESVAFWDGLYRRENDAWIRAEFVRIGWARFGRGFAATALDWLATEPQQYVQWELMHGYLQDLEGVHLRDYWDIWQPTTLQLRLNFAPYPEARIQPDRGQVLAWLERGNRPRDEWVRNHLLYGLAKSAHGDDTRRLLKVFDSLPDKADHWWILQPLADFDALPILRYWLAASGDGKRDELESLIARLEQTRTRTSPAARCCEPTQACLFASVAARSGSDPEIRDALQANAWFEGAASTAAPQVRFLDPPRAYRRSSRDSRLAAAALGASVRLLATDRRARAADRSAGRAPGPADVKVAGRPRRPRTEATVVQPLAHSHSLLFVTKSKGPLQAGSIDLVFVVERQRQDVVLSQNEGGRIRKDVVAVTRDRVRNRIVNAHGFPVHMVIDHGCVAR